MKILDAIRLGWIAFVAAILFVILGCSRQESKYDDKNYGQNPDGAPQSLEQPEKPFSVPASSDAQPTPIVVASPSPEPPAEEEEDPEVEDESPRLIDVVDDEDSIVDDITPIDPEMLVKSDRYRAYFDKEAATGIKEGVGYKSIGTIEGRVHEKLTTTENDGLVISNTFGDGVARSTAIQEIFSSAGDTHREEGQPSVSGIQYLDRLSGSGTCPDVLVCIERLTFVPTEGEPFTLCFHDPETDESAIFPYSPIPNYKGVDFDDAYGDFGPYLVRKFPAGDVECSDPGMDPIIEESVVLTIEASPVDSVEYLLHVNEPLSPDFAVTFQTRRETDDLEIPYIDETLRLHNRAQYIFNEAAAKWVKIIITDRQTIDVAAEAGGGVAGAIAAALVNIDGLSVDLHFELCTDLLATDETDHCAIPEE